MLKDGTNVAFLSPLFRFDLMLVMCVCVCYVSLFLSLFSSPCSPLFKNKILNLYRIHICLATLYSPYIYQKQFSFLALNLLTIIFSLLHPYHQYTKKLLCLSFCDSFTLLSLVVCVLYKRVNPCNRIN